MPMVVTMTIQRVNTTITTAILRTSTRAELAHMIMMTVQVKTLETPTIPVNGKMAQTDKLSQREKLYGRKLKTHLETCSFGSS